MDFWGWWASVEPRTDWIAIFVGFIATLISTIVAVIIALNLQRRDFDKRAAEIDRQNALDAEQRCVDLDTRKRELAEQSEADARSRRDDWRRGILSRAFEVLNDAALFGTHPNDRKNDYRDRKTAVLNAIHSLQVEFRADPQPGGDAVGNWYRRRVEEIMMPSGGTQRGAEVEGLSSRVRSDLGEWAAGRVTNDWFLSQ